MEIKILFFTSPTCSWCPFLEQVLNRIVSEAKHLQLEIIDITKDIEKAEELGIVAIPTIILPNNQRIIGAADEAFIREQLDFFLVMG
ncbi:MAG: thioredoxin family protein [Candidatus Heimdallarchaeota archaeon]|nr:thioredoxin family protein [Candidatus Heimdallarchaeota archaeon]